MNHNYRFDIWAAALEFALFVSNALETRPRVFSDDLGRTWQVEHS